MVKYNSKIFPIAWISVGVGTLFLGLSAYTNVTARKPQEPEEVVRIKQIEQLFDAPNYSLNDMLNQSKSDSLVSHATSLTSERDSLMALNNYAQLEEQYNNGMAVYRAKKEESIKLACYSMIFGAVTPTGLAAYVLFSGFKKNKKQSNDLERKVSGTATEE